MQRTEDFRKGTDTMEREGLKSMDWTEGQLDCRAGRAEKSKPGAGEIQGCGGENRQRD